MYQYLYRAMGDDQKAIHDVDAAIRLQPNTPAAYLNRGLSHAAAEAYEAAIKDSTRPSARTPAPSAPTTTVA